VFSAYLGGENQIMGRIPLSLGANQIMGRIPLSLGANNASIQVNI
jgi:hypothetical protein